MTTDKTERVTSEKVAHKNRVAEVADTFEWMITAFILALVFRAFVMEAYRIPTGSMADTLKGAHFRLRCSQCGYRYDYGFVPESYGLPSNTIPAGNVPLTPVRCPNCGYYQKVGGQTPIANGDRILVLKCIYQFFEPKQWDVVVFKNPLDPTINYIKRLIGRPGETVEIIDGDIYINGQISRKPPKVQNELWMPVYDNDYQPVEPHPVEPYEGLFNGHFWQQPFESADSTWTIDANRPTIFQLDSSPDETSTLVYNTKIGNDFRAAYAYDDIRGYSHLPYCSDLMVRFYICTAEPKGQIGIVLSKYQSRYIARIDFDGSMVIEAQKDEKVTELARKSIGRIAVNKPISVKFADVDHQLIFEFGEEKLTYDLGRGPDDAGPRQTKIEPEVKIFGGGRLTLSHVAILRDIHYTGGELAIGSQGRRATEGNPITLGRDEFFMLGDNSPNSADGRWWGTEGRGNNGRLYRQGIVPHEYLVGKALFVYWPSFFHPFGKSSPVLVPNIGQMRFIYGGSDKSL